VSFLINQFISKILHLKLLTELADDPSKLDNMLTIYNKCDLVPSETYGVKPSSTETTATTVADFDANLDRVLHISCRTLKGLEECRKRIEREIYLSLNYVSLRLLIKQAKSTFQI
jgi:50S ribosomal subunit-associated GTPase HflX